MFGLFGFCRSDFYELFLFLFEHPPQTSFSISKCRYQFRLYYFAFKSEIPYELVPRAREWRKGAEISKPHWQRLYTRVVILGREERANEPGDLLIICWLTSV